MSILLKPIGYVRSTRTAAEDDHWDREAAEIVLDDALGADALRGIEEFSHADVIFCFHAIDEGKVVTGARRPRNNPDWPEVGILAQRGKNRPNRLGLTTVAVVSREDNILRVRGLDAIDGSPVLDIKPVMREFLPRGKVRQPPWANELMRDYWGEAPVQRFAFRRSRDLAGRSGRAYDRSYGRTGEPDRPEAHAGHAAARRERRSYRVPALHAW